MSAEDTPKPALRPTLWKKYQIKHYSYNVNTFLPQKVNFRHFGNIRIDINEVEQHLFIF
jgi:hypothetical protein